MYIYIYIHTSQKECLCIFPIAKKNLNSDSLKKLVLPSTTEFFTFTWNRLIFKVMPISRVEKPTRSGPELQTLRHSPWMQRNANRSNRLRYAAGWHLLYLQNALSKMSSLHAPKELPTIGCRMTCLSCLPYLLSAVGLVTWSRALCGFIGYTFAQVSHSFSGTGWTTPLLIMDHHNLWATQDQLQTPKQPNAAGYNPILEKRKKLQINTVHQ